MDSDEENEEFQSWKGVPGVVVLINAYNPLNTESPTISHVATCQMMRQHLRLASNHYIGVCLYGTGDSETASFGLENVTEICPLNLPNLDDYKKLQSSNVSSYGQAKELKLSDALWHCSKMFTNCKKLLLSRTILMLTRLDSPPVESDHRATYMRVSDLVESNIEIKIINVATEDVASDNFYKNFISEANGGKEVAVPKPISDCKEIENMMFQQSCRHLTLARLSFEIGNGVAIGVGVYSLLKSTGYVKNVNLDRDTNAILTSATKTVKVFKEEKNSNGAPMDVDDAESEPKQLPVLRSELIHYQEYGGERIEISDKEKKMLSNPFGPPMMKLLGFKPIGVICKEKWFLKAGYFLYPNEGIIEGSTVAFKALHQACLEMKVVAICVLCTRVNSRPNIVALSPCSRPLGLNAEIGFDVIKIPFIESVRQIPVEDDEDNIDISEAHRRTMKDIVNTLKFDYKPEMFENPKLQSQYRAVEAIALAEEDSEPFVDTTKPDPAKFQELDEELFEEIFGPFGAVAKRPAARETTVGSKKAKFDGEIDEGLLQNRVSDKKVNLYTVEQLKNILRWKNNPNLPALTGLKKNDLVNLVYEYCS
ncbi:X-ray repair cross-complementing protein 6 [Ostrinia nubilalis]|uniref:X-ray repair cross-complementing protein 6 n=1 Tax=Ostrinia nubilalis TaxID=29057 RepID=UPI0030824880